MSHIRLESIVKSFGPTRVLDGCSVVVEKGARRQTDFRTAARAEQSDAPVRSVRR